MPTRDVIYKVKLSNGREVIGVPQRLSALLATYNHGPSENTVSIERIQVAIVTSWDDVTENFARKA